MTDLSALFAPKSIAIVGASAREGKWGNLIVRNLIDAGYPHRIYPINPGAPDVCGLQAYPNISAIGESVDLALIGVRAESVLDAVDDCTRNGCRMAVIYSSRMAEVGGEGRLRQEAIERRAQDAGLRFLGPNSLGLLASHSDFYASLALQIPPKGPIAFLSQSGNMGVAITYLASRLSIGLHSFVGVGNQANLGLADFLSYLSGDENCSVIAIYMEDVPRPDQFFEAVGTVSSQKPVVILKGGRSEQGSRATLSHTGALATDDRLFNGLARQSGAVIANSYEELLAQAHVFAGYRQKPGERIAVITDGGGFGVVAADVAARVGLQLAVLDPDTEDWLRVRLGPACSCSNPVDNGAIADSDLASYGDAAEACLRDPNVDSLLIVGMLGGYPESFGRMTAAEELETCRRIGKLAHEYAKPIVVQTVWAREHSESLEILRIHGIPVIESLDSAVRSLRALPTSSRPQSDTGRLNIQNPLQIKSPPLETRPDEATAYEFLAQYGVPVPRHMVIDSEEGVTGVGEALGFPVVMKLLSSTTAHKSQVGGVILGINGETATLDAYRDLAERSKDRRVFVVEQVPVRIEVILGVARSRRFGTLLMVGLGGIYAEAFQAVSFRKLPIGPQELIEMLVEARVPGASADDIAPDIQDFMRLALTVAEIVETHEEIEELELNPVALRGDGACVLDAKIAIAEDRSEAAVE